MSTTAAQLELADVAAALTRACGRCRAAVILTVGPDSKRRTLDARPAAGGLYRLDEHGRAVRRHVLDMNAEFRAGAAVLGGGYDRHACR